MSISKDKITIPSNPAYLKVVRQRLKAVLLDNKIDGKITYNLIMAVDEAVMNVIEHSTEYDHSKNIEITISYDDENACFRCLVVNEGKSFDFDNSGNVDLKRHIEEKGESGLGVFLIKKLMDTVRYEVNKNIISLEMVKILK